MVHAIENIAHYHKNQCSYDYRNTYKSNLMILLMILKEIVRKLPHELFKGVITQPECISCRPLLCHICNRFLNCFFFLRVFVCFGIAQKDRDHIVYLTRTDTLSTDKNTRYRAITPYWNSATVNFEVVISYRQITSKKREIQFFFIPLIQVPFALFFSRSWPGADLEGNPWQAQQPR